jgi:hypothetical protein
MRISSVHIIILVCIAIASILIGTVVIISETTGTPIAVLVRDPASTMHMPAFVGLLSNATILIWASAASISLFGASVLPAGHPVKGFLTMAGSLTLFLTLDDVYMIHERIVPRLFGLPEMAVFALYAIAALVLIVKGRQLVRQTAYPLLILAIAALGLSVVVDTLFDDLGLFPIEKPYLVEDGFKILGALLWLAYFAMLTRSALRD